MTENQRHNAMIVLPSWLAEASLRAAHEAGLSRSELVRRLLLDYLAQNGSTTSE
jgi:metal-responsive CopG/Arc/MetJ family transcriptional regulator